MYHDIDAREYFSLPGLDTLSTDPRPDGPADKSLHHQANLHFDDIVEDEDRRWLPIRPSTEDDIYYQLWCAQIAHTEAAAEAKATIFDAMHSCHCSTQGGTIPLIEPTPTVLHHFTPPDLCNYDHVRPHQSHQHPPSPAPQCYGVNQIALSVARNYMALYGNSARTFVNRRQLENDIRDKMSIPQLLNADKNMLLGVLRDTNIPFPPTREIIFAIAHGMKLLRVRGGRTLQWNQYRDNHGNKFQ